MSVLKHELVLFIFSSKHESSASVQGCEMSHALESPIFESNSREEVLYNFITNKTQLHNSLDPMNILHQHKKVLGIYEHDSLLKCFIT